MGARSRGSWPRDGRTRAGRCSASASTWRLMSATCRRSCARRRGPWAARRPTIEPFLSSLLARAGARLRARRRRAPGRLARPRRAAGLRDLLGRRRRRRPRHRRRGPPRRRAARRRPHGAQRRRGPPRPAAGDVTPVRVVWCPTCGTRDDPDVESATERDLPGAATLRVHAALDPTPTPRRSPRCAWRSPPPRSAADCQLQAPRAAVEHPIAGTSSSPATPTAGCCRATACSSTSPCAAEGRPRRRRQGDLGDGRQGRPRGPDGAVRVEGPVGLLDADAARRPHDHGHGRPDLRHARRARTSR